MIEDTLQRRLDELEDEMNSMGPQIPFCRCAQKEARNAIFRIAGDDVSEVICESEIHNPVPEEDYAMFGAADLLAGRLEGYADDVEEHGLGSTASLAEILTAKLLGVSTERRVVVAEHLPVVDVNGAPISVALKTLEEAITEKIREGLEDMQEESLN